MFHSFFNSQAKPRYLFFFLLEFSFTLLSAGSIKFPIRQVLFFLLIILRFSCLDEIKWSIRISKFPRSLCVAFSRTDSQLCIYHLFVWSNLSFLHNSKGIPLLTQLSLVLYSFWPTLLHLLIMWLIISFLSSRIYITVLLYLIYSCFDMIGPYGAVLYCY